MWRVMIKKDFEVKVPRLSKKQTNRANYPEKTTEEYYLPIEFLFVYHYSMALLKI